MTDTIQTTIQDLTQDVTQDATQDATQSATHATAQTMKLNHLSFPSADTAATARFFEQYLGFTISGTWDQ
jgi:catechol-2,3-dioxygenase